MFENEKIMIQRITGGSTPIKAVYDNAKFYNKESIINLQIKAKEFSYLYILTLLNSSLINWFYKQKFTNNSKLTVNLSKEYLGQIPIKYCSMETQEVIGNVASILLYLSQSQMHPTFGIFNQVLDGLVFCQRQPETVLNLAV